MIEEFFLTIRLNISHLFAHSLNGQKALFDPLIGPNRVLLLRVRVNLESMKMKGYSTFSKDPLDGLVSYPGNSLKEPRLFAKRKSEYFTAPADWARRRGWLNNLITI